jgi:hypothetical protein
MDTLTHPAAPTSPTKPPATETDYYSRACALWPRMEPMRGGRVRRDANRVAALVSRRTTLSRQSILTLLGAPAQACEEHVAGH